VAPFQDYIGKVVFTAELKAGVGKMVAMRGWVQVIGREQNIKTGQVDPDSGGGWVRS